MCDEISFTLNSPLTEEDRAKISDAEFEHSNEISFWTPSGRSVTFVKKPQWISCDERLPEANAVDDEGFAKAYLVQDGRWMDVARWDGEYWVAHGYGNVLRYVTAWMELPEPAETGDDR